MKKRLVITACCLSLLIATVTVLSAQLATPNAAGVSLAAVYFTVPDVAKHKKIWVDNMGAVPTMIGKTEMLKMPGVFIILSQGTPDTTAGLIDHLGIWAKDLNPTRAKLTAAGIATMPGAQFVTLPDNVRLEFVDDPAGPDAPAAQHIHYFAPTPGAEARGWYAKMFGATENGRRGGAVPSALFTPPDKWISVDFSAARGGGGGRGGGRGGAPGAAAGAAPAPAAPPAAAPAPPASNKGKVLDRFALEAKGIEALVKKLEAEGVKITKQVSTNADGLKTAMFVDITGNDVELIEGLAGK